MIKYLLKKGERKTLEILLLNQFLPWIRRLLFNTLLSFKLSNQLRRMRNRGCEDGQRWVA